MRKDGRWGCPVATEMPLHSALVRGGQVEPRQKDVPGRKHEVHLSQKQALSGHWPQRRFTPRARSPAWGAMFTLKPGKGNCEAYRARFASGNPAAPARVSLGSVLQNSVSQSVWSFCSRACQAYCEREISRLMHPEPSLG